MRKLEKGEHIEVAKTGSSMNREVYALLLSLKPGEQAIILKGDWKGQTPFTHSIYNQKRLKGRFTVERIIDGTGFLVTRRKNL